MNKTVVLIVLMMWVSIGEMLTKVVDRLPVVYVTTIYFNVREYVSINLL